MLLTARAFAVEAAQLKAGFIRHEHPETFVEDFESHIAALERAMSDQNTKRDAHVSATASVESLIERGMNAVRRPDAIVRNEFRNDPPTLAAWESARHVESHTRTRRRSNGGKDGSDSHEDKKV
jgi:uncharacterized protein (DUF2236 family)